MVTDRATSLLTAILLLAGVCPAGGAPVLAQDTAAPRADSAAAPDPKAWTSSLKKTRGHLEIKFEHLGGYVYPFDDESLFAGETGIANLRKKNLIPERILALNQKNVMIVGYIMPIDFSEGEVRSFMLLPNQQACCYGVIPQINELIYVKMKGGGGTKAAKDLPTQVTGRMTVGERILDESVFCLYFIEADKVESTEEGLKLKQEIMSLQESLLKKGKK